MIITHRPTGINAEASERRSQGENRAWRSCGSGSSWLYLFGSRYAAMNTRVMSPAWSGESGARRGRFEVNPEHEDFPPPGRAARLICAWATIPRPRRRARVHSFGVRQAAQGVATALGLINDAGAGRAACPPMMRMVPPSSWVFRLDLKQLRLARSNEAGREVARSRQLTAGADRAVNSFAESSSKARPCCSRPALSRKATRGVG